MGGAAAATATPAIVPQEAQAQQPAPAAPPPATYAFLNLEEAAFVEAMVDHMVPADDLSPKGTDIRINIYIDRALAGAWGKGDRLYMQGPWKRGVPSQGYQLPLTPAQLYRAGITATNAHCRKTYNNKRFDQLDRSPARGGAGRAFGRPRQFRRRAAGARVLDHGYQTVMEGMFSDPIHGGNRNKAGWKLIGFPGAIAVHRENIEKFKNKPFPNDPVSIADMS